MGARDRFELAVSRFGAHLGNLNDRLHGEPARRWERRVYRLVDRIAGRLYTYGEQ